MVVASPASIYLVLPLPHQTAMECQPSQDMAIWARIADLRQESVENLLSAP